MESLKLVHAGNNASLAKELELLHNASASLFDFVEEDANEIYQLVLESQLPHKTINLLFTIAD